jgi:5-bromo-4-chloroindolyl phosphate hydrolysis protein
MSSSDPQLEREVRAARNQSTFRAVNEKMTALNEAWQSIAGSYVIACECADMGCVETLEITEDEYELVRKHPNRFVVLPAHVYPEVEMVVDEHETYVTVEKIAKAGEVAEALDPRNA